MSPDSPALVSVLFSLEWVVLGSLPVPRDDRDKRDHGIGRPFQIERGPNKIRIIM